MQPYFFPYIGYFQLIHASDIYVHFDDVQFERKSWMHRNRICTKGSKDIHYINAPIIKPEYRSQFKSVKLQDEWRKQIYEKLSGLYNYPYFHQLEEMLASVPSDCSSLLEFNIFIIEYISKKLKFNTKFLRFSEMNVWFEKKPSKGTWGLEIANHLGASEYVNAIGGMEFISNRDAGNIKLGFLDPKIDVYEQRSSNGVFNAGLSILDLIANLGFENLKSHTVNYQILWKS